MISLIPEVKNIKKKPGAALKNLSVQTQILDEMPEDSYRLDISENQILIQAGSYQAILYGRQTLNQIRSQSNDVIPCLSIEDSPIYSYRGFHIDCARHFFTIKELKKMIQVAARFKFNYFHWHFSDDQGWRIESHRYPLLHKIGAERKGDHFGNYQSNEVETHFYTRQEVSDLVIFAKDLGIEIIPEIGIPGHVTAILAAYPHLSCKEHAVEVGSKAGIFWDILCPGKESTFEFIENLLEDVLELFPSKFVHIGGDEAPKRCWRECVHCQKKMMENRLTNEQELQGYMMNRVAKYLETKGRQAIVWNDAANGGNLDPSVTIQQWTEDKKGVVSAHTRKGGKVILSPMMNSYCDYPYGFITLKSMHQLNFNPEGLAADSVIGNECLIWTEYIRDNQTLETMSWPRFSAAADIGWSGNAVSDYDNFQERLEALLHIFDEEAIHITPKSGWIPSEEETEHQLMTFKKNFLAEDMADFKKAQGEV